MNPACNISPPPPIAVAYAADWHNRLAVSVPFDGERIGAERRRHKGADAWTPARFSTPAGRNAQGPVACTRGQRRRPSAPRAGISAQDPWKLGMINGWCCFERYEQRVQLARAREPSAATYRDDMAGEFRGIAPPGRA